MKVGDTVVYKNDLKPKRQWYLYDIYNSGQLCRIVLIRDNKYMNERNGEMYLNANIVNLPITEIEII